jgi:hypothetical protein
MHKFYAGYNAYYVAIENEEFLTNEANQHLQDYFKNKDSFDDLVYKLKKRL